MSAIATVPTRECRKCMRPRGLADFYVSNRSTCKECVKSRVRAHRTENIDQIRAYDRERGMTPARKAKVVEYAKKVQADPVMREHRNAYKARWTADHAVSRRALHAAYRLAHPRGFRARKAVQYAVDTGRLVRGPCEECGDNTVHGHHDDYAKPLEVRWLCPWHHRLWHSANGPGANLDLPITDNDPTNQENNACDS